MPAALRRKSIEWLALNMSQWINVSIHACSIKEEEYRMVGSEYVPVEQRVYPCLQH
jgi:hypothetical protein